METKPMTQVALVFSNTLYYTDALSPSTRSYRLSAQRGMSKTSIHSAQSKSDGQQAAGTSKVLCQFYAVILQIWNLFSFFTLSPSTSARVKWNDAWTATTTKTAEDPEFECNNSRMAESTLLQFCKYFQHITLLLAITERCLWKYGVFAFWTRRWRRHIQFSFFLTD